MTAENDLQVAIQVARSGDTERAYELFATYIQKNPFNFHGYLWLSELAKTLEEQTFALERAQALCPSGPEGSRGLQDYLNELRGEIALAAPAAVASIPVLTEPARPALVVGESSEAEFLYQAERLALFEQEAEPRPEVPDRPVLNFHWVFAPSLLLFVLLVFIQFEWQQFPLPFLAVPGLLSVTAGGLLVTASGQYMLTYRGIGRLAAIEANDPVLLQRSIRFSGWLLVILPFTILIRAIAFGGLH